MPRYLIVRPYSQAIESMVDARNENDFMKIVENNLMDETTWLHSYIDRNKNRAFCIYDGPSPEAIRSAAKRNNLPIEMIVEVSEISPYFNV